MRSIGELLSLKGRVAFVTGGAGHMGLAIGETLLELGALVIISDLKERDCKKRTEFLNQKGFTGKAIPLPADLSSEKKTRQAILKCKEIAGQLDILIHAAAFVGTDTYPGWVCPLEKQTISAWDRALRINMTSAFTLVQAALPLLHQALHPSVIFISSIYGIVGPDFDIYEGTTMTTPAGYAASKAGLAQLGRYLACALAPKVRVNTVIAGGIFRHQPTPFCEAYIKRTPLKRMATEEDFKGVIAYLASDLSLYVTGSEIKVDGGWTAW